MANLPIVAWVDERDGQTRMCSWVGNSKRVRVRNFDPSKGLMQELTEADIVETGGTEVTILTD